MTERTDASSRRVAILILGMHRSGTSALARVVNLLGASMPSDLVPGSLGNPLGHWEPWALVHLHDEMLGEAGSHVNSICGIDEAWLRSPEASTYKDRMKAFIQAEFEGSPLFVLKDPRMCLFAPLWCEALEEMGIAPRVVVPVRHPLEVARSLVGRQNKLYPQEIWSEGRVVLIWLQHVLSAERHTRHLPRSFLLFDRLLQDWRREVSRLEAQLGIRLPDRDSRAPLVDQFLGAEHRNERVADQAGLSSLTGKTYEALVRCQDAPYSGQGDFDFVSAMLQDMSSMLRGYVRDLEALPPALAHARSEVGQRDALIGQLSERLEASFQAESERQRELEAAALERDALSARIAALEARASAPGLFSPRRLANRLLARSRH